MLGMDIGDERRIIIFEPLDDPIHIVPDEPVYEPAETPEREAEPVPV